MLDAARRDRTRPARLHRANGTLAGRGDDAVLAVDVAWPADHVVTCQVRGLFVSELIPTPFATAGPARNRALRPASAQFVAARSKPTSEPRGRGDRARRGAQQRTL